MDKEMLQTNTNFCNLIMEILSSVRLYGLLEIIIEINIKLNKVRKECYK